MTTLSRAAAALVALLLGGAAGIAAEAPNVVSLQPVAGRLDVPPGPTEIVVTFDRDMDRSGYSFTGGGPSFPALHGQAGWRSPRECVLPVKLEPGREYRFGLNGPTQQGFKSAEGVPLAPQTFTFRTAAASPAPAGGMAEQNRTSIRQLREAIEQRYSYLEVRPVDWPAAWKAYEPRLTAAATPREFAVIAGEMLAQTKDPHIWLLENQQIVPAFRRVAEPNANPRLLPRLVRNLKQHHPMVASGLAAPGVGYLAIHSWERKYAPKLLEAVYAAMDELRPEPALIIDVRFNSGGDETIARALAGCFVEKRVLYAGHVSLDPAAPGKFSAPVERWLEPNREKPPYRGKIAVLMGPVNMSSAEAFLLMMKQVPGAKLLGTRSYGASGNPQPHVLANGVTVLLPSWKARTAEGVEFEGQGLAPAIEVPASAAELKEKDPVLASAVARLGSP